MPTISENERRALEAMGRRARDMARERERCRVCEAPIPSCELCEDCAKGNDPFATHKRAGDHRPVSR